MFSKQNILSILGYFLYCMYILLHIPVIISVYRAKSIIFGPLTETVILNYVLLPDTGYFIGTILVLLNEIAIEILAYNLVDAIIILLLFCSVFYVLPILREMYISWMKSYSNEQRSDRHFSPPTENRERQALKCRQELYRPIDYNLYERDALQDADDLTNIFLLLINLNVERNINREIMRLIRLAMFTNTARKIEIQNRLLTIVNRLNGSELIIQALRNLLDNFPQDVVQEEITDPESNIQLTDSSSSSTEKSNV